MELVSVVKQDGLEGVDSFKFHKDNLVHVDETS